LVCGMYKKMQITSNHNMLAKFNFLKERNNRKQGQLTGSQVKAVIRFAIFVKALAGKVCSLLSRFWENHTFEDKLDMDIMELEACIGRKLKRVQDVR